MTNQEHIERRQGYAPIDPAFLAKIEHHLATFEARQEVWQKTFEAGKLRMDSLETRLANVLILVNTADGFIRAVRVMTVIVSVLLTAMVSMSTWIVMEKNSEIRAVQTMQHEHTTQIKRTLDVVERLVMSQERDSQRLERHLDSMKLSRSPEREGDRKP